MTDEEIEALIGRHEEAERVCLSAGHIDKADRHQQDAEALRQLHDEVKALREDALRYRWLCDGNGYFMEEEGLCGHFNEKARADSAIDEAIDAALSQEDK